MRHSPTHDEVHDKSNDRHEPGLRKGLEKAGPEKTSPEKTSIAHRLALAAALAGCVGLASLTTGTSSAGNEGGSTTGSLLRIDSHQDVDAYHEDRGGARSSKPATTTPKPSSVAKGHSGGAKASAGSRGNPANAKPVPPKPVVGLTQLQMNNAARIVAAGKDLKLPKRAYVIAVACAMQESNLLNLASDVIPESFGYPHEGSGSDHDSVGLFQQRPSSGWGSVQNLMRPGYAATMFYRALVQVPGWQGMELTYAAQAVQVSAYPLAYAQHEWRAQTVVDALT